VAELELQSLQKRFGEVHALKNLDLTFHSGEFVSLLGPSGCGKTTALRIIAGFEHADAGRVLLNGKDITATPANRRDMGMVFQAYSLFPNMSAQDNVEFGLRVRGVSRAKRAKIAADLLEMVGLASARGRHPHQLSGGQQQRVALARALAIQPAVLLLDEPLSALDAKVRVQLRDEIRRLQTELGITTAYVTHDQEEALAVSDRVVVLSAGQIEQVGPPEEIYGNPQTIFVAEFIGTMNRVHGTVLPGGSGLVAFPDATIVVDAARTEPAGESVIVLIRPESIELQRRGENGRDGAAVEGQVSTHTFLGSVTRLGLSTSLGQLVADIPSSTAFSLPVGTPVNVRWDTDSVRLLRVPSEGSVAVHDDRVLQGTARSA
jgi:putative spermidine/putrescine transport system ATP-binding protein